jgi:hypothetical protein
MGQVAVSGRGPGEDRAAARALGLGRRARLLALMSEEVTERGELPAVATVLPALRFRSRRDHSDAAWILAAQRHRLLRWIAHWKLRAV